MWHGVCHLMCRPVPPRRLCIFFFAWPCSAQLQGADAAQTHMVGGYLSLKEAVATFHAQGKGKLTALVPDLEGVNPDDAFSRVPCTCVLCFVCSFPLGCFFFFVVFLSSCRAPVCATMLT